MSYILRKQSISNTRKWSATQHCHSERRTQLGDENVADDPAEISDHGSSSDENKSNLPDRFTEEQPHTKHEPNVVNVVSLLNFSHEISDDLCNRMRLNFQEKQYGKAQINLRVKL